MEGRPDWAGSDGHGKRKSFNFADLPCPPQSVWEANNYTYYPGRPYQPLLALPQKLQDIDPAWSTCISNKYQGIDPPRALSPVAALDPATTQGDPVTKATPADPILGPPHLPEETGSVTTRPSSSISSSDPVKDPPPSDPTKSAGRPKSAAAELTSTPVSAPTNTPAASFDPSLAAVVQGQTIAENGPPVTIDNSAITYSSGLIYVGTKAGPLSRSGQRQDPNSILEGTST
ncbi:MAG: hypothetical protein M1830_007708, partial [Pleopsidium flavum]